MRYPNDTATIGPAGAGRSRVNGRRCDGGRLLIALQVLAVLICGSAFAAAPIASEPAISAAQTHQDHAGHRMQFDASGMVMNSNSSELPRGCSAISRDHEFEVSAGTEFATRYPGSTYAMSQHEYTVEPCSRVTVTFINTDEVRHQWMVHGLPRYLYPQGMFHLEAAGGARQTGTFIVPSDNRTYLVHCDIPQHMEKGMKGQLIVGSGSGDLWAVPGISRAFNNDDYLATYSFLVLALAVTVGMLSTLWLLWR